MGLVTLLLVLLQHLEQLPAVVELLLGTQVLEFPLLPDLDLVLAGSLPVKLGTDVAVGLFGLHQLPTRVPVLEPDAVGRVVGVVVVHSLVVVPANLLLLAEHRVLSQEGEGAGQSLPNFLVLQELHLCPHLV